MDINKFTEKAREAVTQAQSIAVGMGHQDIDSEHLALALIRQEQGIVPRILDQMGVQTAALAVAVEEKLRKRPSVSGGGMDPNRISITQRLAKVLGDAESYLDPKKMEGRLQWSAESHKREYENDWVVDILPGNGEYDLGYDYHECGACKLCNDEGCPELAAYICRMDFVLADIMNMKLVRTGTIAEGAPYCDFRYSRIRSSEEK